MAATPPIAPALRASSHNVPIRSSAVEPTSNVPFSREPKARREALAKQLPLQEGRKVAFHPPARKTADGGTAEADENTWILAVIIKCINRDKNRYEVQDVEPQEDGQPGLCYNTTLRAIIPLPDPNAPLNDAAHPNVYQEFPAGSTVMGLYPDTSCFYRAEVIQSPTDFQLFGWETSPTYRLKFEDDDDQEHVVAAQFVIEWPGGEPPRRPPLDFLNLPVTSEPRDLVPEYVRGQAATVGADPREEETRASEPETPVTPAPQNMWDFEEDCESERRSSDRSPSCDPPASSGSPVLPPPHPIPSAPSVHVSPSINNPTLHLTNSVKDNITEQPTIASSTPDPDPATKTPETLDPGPTQSNITISSKFWSRILRLTGRRTGTQQQSNAERSSNIEMHTVAPGRGKVLIYGEPVAETEEETPLPHSVILFTPQPRAPSMDSQASGILDTSRSEEKLGFWYYICYCKCS